MTYKLAFHPEALDEWRKLDGSVSAQFKKKLKERLEQPHVDGARVAGGDNLYKIKLRALGYRLVYHVNQDRVTVLVLSVGKRERNAAYHAALSRR